MRLHPHLMFQGDMAEALSLWKTAFPEMTIELVDDGKQGTIEIAGQMFTVFDSPPVHDFTFTPSTSLMVHCDTREEVKRLFDILSPNGTVMMPLGAHDFSNYFAFFQDKFGVSWQVMVRQT